MYLLSFAGVIWRRLSGQYGFIAVEGPEGVRIRRGLLQTISETVPYGRIQAVRQVEPLLWRPFGWCRLEVDVAGATARNQRGEGTSVVRKALLPVGSQQDSWHLLARLLGAPDPARTAPPRRARLKAPLSFHFLSAGHDDTHAVCVTGRINRATTWVPLEKTQSIRRVQGPLQRPLGLATVHVDVAGKRARAEFRDREVEEADQLVEELTALSRAARLRAHGACPGRRAADAAPSGWYPDPSGRHEQRYWHDGRWTEHVGRRRAAERRERRLRRRREAHREVVDGADARRVDELWPGSISYSGMRLCHSRSATRSSRRARCDPRQRWMPPPKAMWRLTSRSKRTTSASGNSASSVLAEPIMTMTWSPLWTGHPPSSVSCDGHPGDAHDRGLPAQQLLDGVGDERGVLDELAPVLGVLGQEGEHAVERGGDRVEAGDQEEEADVEDVLAGEAVALDLGVEEVREQVVLAAPPRARRGPR